MTEPARDRAALLGGLSITTKLVLIVGVFVAIVVALTALVGVTMKVQAGATAYIYGESLWSKGQKDAVYYLTLYAQTGDEDAYRRFREALAIPLGDRHARIELEKPEFDPVVVEGGFRAGGNHPDDIPNMIFLFRRFRHVPFVAKPITIWTAADDYVTELDRVGRELRADLFRGPLSDRSRAAALERIATINSRVTPLERDFSAALAEGTRKLRRIVLGTILGVTTLLLTVGVAIALFLSKQLREAILRLRAGALRIARGDFSQRIALHSRDEIGDLAVAFNEMADQRELAERELAKARDEALRASRAKSDFLSTMSHEIRTPMNSIVGLSELLWETPLTDEQRGYVRRLANAGNNLVNLISDILDLSRIESGRLELEEIEFDLPDLVEKNSEVFALHAREKGIDLVTEVEAGVPVRIVGDPGRLRQVLANLVGNALKFTDRGRIVVRVEHDAAAGLLRFSVRDTGIGIPDDKLEAIFESFTQADSSTTRRFGGTGLGLAICRRLLERMGGGITVESAVGQGSRFAFTIPAATPKPVALVSGPRPIEPVRTVAPVPRSTELRAPLRILLAEDSEDNRLLIQTYFRRAGDTVEIAENGEIALAKYRNGRFDLVLMDMQMPIMSGYDATRAIRAWEAEQGIKPVPIIALTAFAMKEEREKSLMAGCTLHLTKPIKKATLMEAIERAVPRVERVSRTG